MNRAATFTLCDWWAFLDYTVFAQVLPPGKPKIFTTVISAETSAIHGRPFKPDMTLDSIMGNYMAGGWTIYTATASLALAAHLGATQIDVYGADWEPDAPDWDGVMLASNTRHADRWAQERVLWDQLCGHLNEKGITIERIR